MSEPADINPYAPSLSTEAVSLQPMPLADDPSPSLVGTLYLAIITLAAVIISGALFGLLIALFIALVGGIQGAGVDYPLAGILLLVVAGVIYGAIIAAIFAVPTVIVVLCLSAPLVPLSRGWKQRQARVFSGVCGFLSGGLPLVSISSLEVTGLISALVPSVFGCVGTILIVRWLIRTPKPPRTRVVATGDTLVEPAQQDVT